MKTHLQRLLCASLLCCMSTVFLPTVHAQDITFCQSVISNGNIKTLRVFAVYTGTGTSEEFASYGVSVYFNRSISEFFSIDYNENLWDECYYELNPFVGLDTKVVGGSVYYEYFYATGADMKPSSDNTMIGTSPIWLFDAHFYTGGTNLVASAVGTADASETFYDHYDNTCYDIIVKPLEAIQIQVKVFLQGPLSGATMNTTLASSSLLPLSQPYHTAPHNYAGVESVTSMPNNIVDWVIVELRDSNTPSTIIARKAALLQTDGTVIDINGSNTLTFDGVSAGQYYVAVRHRNHLGVMTNSVSTFN